LPVCRRPGKKITTMLEPAQLDRPLRALTATPGVCGSLVATEDGLPMAIRLQAEHDREALAAAAAVIGRLAARTISAFDRGQLELGVLEAEKLRLMVRPLSIGFLLVLADLDANIGLIAVEMAAATELLERAAAVIGGNEIAGPRGVA
jgi:predicted regulator of Ras-like GTPase activity (Roadblock/LC7/MglB family)